jgi:hypothetical protein
MYKLIGKYFWLLKNIKFFSRVGFGSNYKKMNISLTFASYLLKKKIRNS